MLCSSLSSRIFRGRGLSIPPGYCIKWIEYFFFFDLYWRLHFIFCLIFILPVIGWWRMDHDLGWMFNSFFLGQWLFNAIHPLAPALFLRPICAEKLQKFLFMEKILHAGIKSERMNFIELKVEVDTHLSIQRYSAGAGEEKQTLATSAFLVEKR